MSQGTTDHRHLIDDLVAIDGGDFFRQAARNIAREAEVCYAFITECCDYPTTRLRMLAFCHHDQLLDNMEYPLANTPCEDVIGGDLCYYPENIQGLFPYDQDLVDLEAVGYMAVPVFNSTGVVSGHIVILDTKPLDRRDWLTFVLQSYAARCGAELERANTSHLSESLQKGFHLPADEHFFAELAKVVGEILRADYTVIAELEEYEDQRFSTLAVYHRGHQLEASEFTLDGLSLDLRQASVLTIVKEALLQYPHSRLFQETSAEGIIAAPLLDSARRPIGLLCILHQTPIERAEKLEAILKVYAVRASCELERVRAERRWKLYSEILASTDDLLSLVDANYVYRAVNQSYSKKFARPADEIIGDTVVNLHGEEVFHGGLKEVLDRSLRGEVNTIEFWRDLPDGSSHCIQGRHNPYYGAEGQVEGVVVCARDITELKLAEQALSQSEQRLRSMYDDTPSIFFSVSADANIVSVNAFGAQKLGYTVNDLLNSKLSNLVHEEDKAKLLAGLADSFAANGEAHSWELRKRHRNGDIIWVRETARLVQGDQRQPILFIVSEDISERHKLSQELSYQASHDSLTGLINRFEFERRLQRLLEQSLGTPMEHVVCYLDLDQFKVINDSCGHLAGDTLLKNLAAFLALKLRKGDSLARLGGDEFGVLMENCDLVQAEHVAENLRRSIEEFHFIWEQKKYSVGVSIGVAAVTSNTLSIDEVMSTVDAACYVAKDSGRNRIHIYRDHDQDIRRRRGEMNWVNRIKDAISDNRLQLFAQEIVDLQSDHSAYPAYELLVRLQEEDELILPGAFLPAAERYDLSVQIDRWVVARAFQWLGSDSQPLEKMRYCTINLSGLSLGDGSFLAFVKSELSNSKVSAEKICFEITETATIANLASAIAFIGELRAMGFQFALDDFGSGVSSFGYLKNLAVDYIKIDGGFIKDMIDDPIDFAMVKSINEIAQVMGKKTIAEWVENKETLACLKDIGVDYAQGYGIHRPVKIA
ncbi:EAL domain-containing protein [Pseudomaricurvus alkylphenolicus]|uniref:EAL domain-containing protein n=1 Tax=Pseudomaricurvus alkylphenolicus TaxID=1306991 RepID=UPI001421CF94|nr:EAL domain-containing protein [Pseudomaricurvus alkylphenolicus]NIB41739.1 EAL domain-containing protein [Pseudomaricurvus alkylphenolicus]